MLEDYVNYKQAKLLKEKGFSQEFTATPSLYIVQKWLRNTHNIHLVIHKDRIDEWSVYGHEIAPIEFTVFPLLTGFDSYEEALSAGITKALKSLKSV